ncbi:hypothetical protein B0F90DRAFT_1775313 [Multifurca ochricompacta]|uniref:Uncharacterized protein n=1 Tax=Multifurca ochricompacta TaxID=376703 RepID=A0AAD4LXP2_9AGAM|nr:hypothetical protein B0F90DRAFT_1775313 [Multifurca ochricompacta]
MRSPSDQSPTLSTRRPPGARPSPPSPILSDLGSGDRKDTSPSFHHDHHHPRPHPEISSSSSSSYTKLSHQELRVNFPRAAHPFHQSPNRTAIPFPNLTTCPVVSMLLIMSHSMSLIIILYLTLPSPDIHPSTISLPSQRCPSCKHLSCTALSPSAYCHSPSIPFPLHLFLRPLLCVFSCSN